MKEFLAMARGEKPADLVIKGAQVANVYTLEYEAVDVAIGGNKIVGLGKHYDGKTIVDAAGLILIPGMIDAHVHIESTMLSPFEFARCVASRGTTSVMADPHEIANVLGMQGIEYMYMASRGLPIDVFLGAPSCVPASPYETPFEDLEMDRITEMFQRGWCTHLGEVMNFPGVIKGDDGVWGKLKAAGSAVLTGHAPGVNGKELCAYILAGISSDHECSMLEEALEKLRRGMWLMIREGASAPDLRTLLPLIKSHPHLMHRCMVVSDDITAKYIVQNGHMDEKVRIMVREGLDPLIALRLVTLSPALYFGLNDRGGIAPGLLADLVLVDNLTDCQVVKAWKSGRQTVEAGNTTDSNLFAMPYRIPHNDAVKITPPVPEQHQVPALPDADLYMIGIKPQVLTTTTLRTIPTVREGLAVTDTERDIAKIAVLERHRGSGRLALGFVSGLGIKRGAIASSVAHDAHHYVALGMDDQSISTALKQLASHSGGLAVVLEGEVLGYVPLPVAGLMSLESAPVLAKTLDELERKTKLLGIEAEHPFMILSFLSLSVIPELKLTDQGYVDITRNGVQPLFGFNEYR